MKELWLIEKGPFREFIMIVKWIFRLRPERRRGKKGENVWN